MAYTTLNLIEDVKLNSHVPTGQNTFTPAQVLTLADLCMQTLIAPKVSSVRENYWMTSKEYVVDGSPSTITDYEIPPLALGSAIVEAKLLVSQVYYPLDRIMVSELINTQFSPRSSYAFYVEDNLIKLLPNAGLPGSLVLWYYRVPSKLVLPTACAKIASINGNAVTVESTPGTWTTANELDISSSQPGFNVIMKDTNAVSIVGNTITFASLSDRVKVGDYISLAGESCVVQCPQEWIKVLVQAVTCKIYEIQNYSSKLKASKAVLDEMVTNTMNIISPRIAEKAKVIQGGGGLLLPGARRWIVGRNSN